MTSITSIFSSTKNKSNTPRKNSDTKTVSLISDDNIKISRDSPRKENLKSSKSSSSPVRSPKISARRNSESRSGSSIMEDINKSPKDSPRKESLRSSKSIFNSSPRKSPKSSARKSTHLIFDRIVTNRLILKEYIKAYGGDVAEVESTDEVIENIKKNGEYTIIWIDIAMPEMDSIECVSYLRNVMKYSGPIIALIGYTNANTRELCYNADINHLISKPFDLTSINAYIEKYIYI